MDKSQNKENGRQSHPQKHEPLGLFQWRLHVPGHVLSLTVMTKCVKNDKFCQSILKDSSNYEVSPKNFFAFSRSFKICRCKAVVEGNALSGRSFLRKCKKILSP